VGLISNIRLLLRIKDLYNEIISVVKGGEKMDKDKITTISGLIVTLAGAVAVFFSDSVGPVITEVAKGIALVFVAVATYFTNKSDPS